MNKEQNAEQELLDSIQALYGEPTVIEAIADIPIRIEVIFLFKIIVII